MQKESKIYVAGHRGLVGSALVNQLRADGFDNIITRTHKELDLIDPQQTEAFFASEKPEFVFLVAAKVGGIVGNTTYPAEFIRDNLLIELNVIHSAYTNGVTKLLFVGSSCIYPKLCPQPIKEEYLLTGPLEPTNAPYALAKIAGLSLCSSYRKQYNFNAISCMPTNLYGVGDNYNLETSHVLPALLRKCHEAKLRGDPSFQVWGTGTPKREFLDSRDAASAMVFLMQNYEEGSHINVGTGKDISIGDLVSIVKDVVGFEGDLVFDTTKPDGTPQKLLDTSKINTLGWTAKISLRDGVKHAYDAYVASLK